MRPIHRRMDTARRVSTCRPTRHQSCTPIFEGTCRQSSLKLRESTYNGRNLEFDRRNRGLAGIASVQMARAARLYSHAPVRSIVREVLPIGNRLDW